VVLVLSLFLGVLEIGLRIVAPYGKITPRKSKSFILESNIRGVQLMPSSTFILDQATYTTNAWGFRDYEFQKTKPPGTVRIAVLGDSFTEGLGEAQADSIPKQLEESLNKKGIKAEVWNCGVRGGSPAVYLLWLKTLVDYNLDVVVLNLFDNDMDDDAGWLVKTSFYRSQAYWSLSPTLRQFQIPTHLYCYYWYLYSKPLKKKYSQEIFGSKLFVRENKRSDGKQNAIGSNSLGYMDDAVGWEEHWNRTRTNLEQIKLFLADKNISLLVVHIPSSKMFPNSFDSETKKLEKDFFGVWLARWSIESGTSFVSLYTPLAELSTKGKPSLFQAQYAHFNKEGLEKAAGWIEPELHNILRKR
jgi:lysophospholipase L1-like esterase